jgi:hypothetical protein
MSAAIRSLPDPAADLPDPDDLPQYGFDAHQVAIMIGYMPNGTPRGTKVAKNGAERVRTLIKTGRLAARWTGNEWRIFSPTLKAFMTEGDDPSVAKVAS